MAKEATTPKPQTDFGPYASADLRLMAGIIRKELRDRKQVRMSTAPQIGSVVRITGGRHKDETGEVKLHLGATASVVETEDGVMVRVGNERLEAFQTGRNRRKTG